MDETKTNLYQNNGKRKVWGRKGKVHDQKHTATCVKHGGGSFMAWACMAANGNGSLAFNNDVDADRSSDLSSEVFRSMLSAHSQPNTNSDRMKLCNVAG